MVLTDTHTLVWALSDGALVADPLPWWEKYVLRTGIPTLAIRAGHVLTLGRLPGIHKDPV